MMAPPTRIMCEENSTYPIGTSWANSGDDDVLAIAGIFDKTSFNWGDELFQFTFQMIREGWFDYVDPDLASQKWLHATADSKCDESAAIKAYWRLRGMHGIVGARCSGAPISVARIASLEEVPQVSPSSTSARLSDKDEFPNFSRLAAPDDYRGEVGATMAMLRSFDWDRVTILTSDTQFSKDWTNEFRRLWTGSHDDGTGKWKGDVSYSNSLRLHADGSLDLAAARQVLQDVPTDDPRINSRVILLVAHDTAVLPLLDLAESMDFQPDSIWVGPSAWTGRSRSEEWLKLTKSSFPGYLGVVPFQYNGERQSEFL